MTGVETPKLGVSTQPANCGAPAVTHALPCPVHGLCAGRDSSMHPPVPGVTGRNDDGYDDNHIFYVVLPSKFCYSAVDSRSPTVDSRSSAVDSRSSTVDSRNSGSDC
jgi:hypothetical protein